MTTRLASDVLTVLPESAPGLVNYRRETGGADQYGTESTIEAILEAGEAWEKKHPYQPFSIGDISRKGGGPFTGHAGHRKGLEPDVRPKRRDGKNLPVAIFMPEYSQELTRDLILTIKATGLLVKVLFNDKVLINEGLCQYFSGHSDHLHFRFKVAELRTLRKGMAGKDVARLKSRLIALDFLPATITGDVFDNDLYFAVGAFQATHKLTKDCEVGPVTRSVKIETLRHRRRRPGSAYESSGRRRASSFSSLRLSCLEAW